MADNSKMPKIVEAKELDDGEGEWINPTKVKEKKKAKYEQRREKRRQVEQKKLEEKFKRAQARGDVDFSDSEEEIQVEQKADDDTYWSK